MLSKFLMAMLAAGSLALPAVADDQDDDDGGRKTSVCHRTQSQAIKGFFPGHVIRVSTRTAAMHVSGHNDVVLGPDALRALGFGSGRGDDDDDDDDGGRRKAICLTDASGAVFDAKGRVVQGGGAGEGPAGPG